MLIASLHVPDSPWYWTVVAVSTVVFALIDLEALRDHRFTRWHGVSVAAYVGAFVIVVGVGLGGPGWWVFPAALRVAVWAMFLGGQFLAEAIRGEQWLAHPERRTPQPRLPKISEDQLVSAEEYDDQWLLEDRERTRLLALHEREEREHRKRRTPHER